MWVVPSASTWVRLCVQRTDAATSGRAWTLTQGCLCEPKRAPIPCVDGHSGPVVDIQLGNAATAHETPHVIHDGVLAVAYSQHCGRRLMAARALYILTLL